MTDLDNLDAVLALPAERIAWLSAELGYSVGDSLRELRATMVAEGRTTMREATADLMRYLLKRGNEITAEDARDAEQLTHMYQRLRAEK